MALQKRFSEHLSNAQPIQEKVIIDLSQKVTNDEAVIPVSMDPTPETSTSMESSPSVELSQEAHARIE